MISRSSALKLITDSSVYGNLGLFIGAGMSMAILNDRLDTVALSWKELIFKCASEFDINLREDINIEGLSYPEIATKIGKIIAEKESCNYNEAISKLKEKVSELTCWYPESDKRIIFGKIIEDIDPNWIITTNYDLVIECLLTGKCLSLSPSDQLIAPQNLIPIYHLHGIRTNPDSIIISQEDYISLFRPNQYRQQKLSLSIKESTTLIIGYGLGDVNVLTSVDWTKNLYINQKINYPHDIIQLLYTDNPNPNPYRDRNDILIIEFDNLKDVLTEITEAIKIAKADDVKNNRDLDELNEIFKNPSEENVNAFIDEKDFRISTIETMSQDNVKLISGFLELFSKAIDETWERAKPRAAFYAYNENLLVLLDILERIELLKLPPALLESIAYNLNHVGFFIGTGSGKSHAANQTWKDRRANIPCTTLNELKNIARTRNYSILTKILEPIS